MSTSDGMETRYFLTDHLGSVRQVVAADGSVIEQNDYYPFGKRWAAVAAPISDNRHRFSGKEEQAFLSLPYVDFGARMYNPDWGRWFTQDPLLEKYYPIGQYCYCAGNPISRIDLDGKDWVRGIDGNNYLWMDNVTKNSETPDGYVYVGSNNNDILTNQTIEVKRLFRCIDRK